MSRKFTTGIKRSAEEASLHDNGLSLRDCQQSFSGRVTLPMNLIIGLILPFVQDRSTWNHLCVANKELKDAGQTTTPPWPETTVQQAGLARSMVFSPCGHYLACAIASREGPAIVEILDRRNGQQTSLRGHLGDISCLSFSGDGKYLASGGNERLIRIWPTNSTRKPTQHSRNKTLPGHPTGKVQCLAFASDSNILASGSCDVIKLWNVEDGVCIHSIHHDQGNISSLAFLGVGESIQCLAAATDGSLIRISRNNGHDSEFTSDLVVDRRKLFVNTSFSQCGSFLATLDPKNKLCLYEIKTNGVTTMTESVTLPGCCSHLRTNGGMTFSPYNKMLAVISDTSREDDTVVRLLDVKDLRLQRQFKWQRRRALPVALALAPSNRYLAISCSDGKLRLWTA
jgi:WD40 repeat protein